jgi:hypothetical protein
MGNNMSDIIKINTSTNQFQKVEQPLTIAEYKEQGKWPFDFITAKGLVNVINDLSTRLNRNVVGLEIGVCKGENIVHFLEQTNRIDKIHCIDPYLPYMDWIGPVTQEDVDLYLDITLKNFEPHKDKIVFYKDTSDNCVSKFSNEQFDYVFIDGDHSYEGVKKDLNNYYSKVKTGGVFSGHDINLQSVQQAVREFREQNLITNQIQFTDVNVWYWVK